jgi:hypothetical protein
MVALFGKAGSICGRGAPSAEMLRLTICGELIGHYLTTSRGDTKGKNIISSSPCAPVGVFLVTDGSRFLPTSRPLCASCLHSCTEAL